LINLGRTIGSLRRKASKAAYVDLTQKISIYSLIGLPLLFASTYFLRPLEPIGAYLLPSRDLFRLIILPSLVAVVTGSGILYVVSMTARRWCAPHVASIGAVLALTLLTLIGLKGVMDAAGFEWQGRLPRSQDLVVNLRLVRIIVFVGVVTLVWASRNSLPKLSRLLSSLGFAFGCLAAIRMMILWTAQPAVPTLTLSAIKSAQAGIIAAPTDPLISEGRPRRVVWVIFDELDFRLLYSTDDAAKPELPNFAKLARTAVFATNANSPASATLQSIPGLLTGIPLGRNGIKIDSAALLSLERPDGKFVAFNAATSIFGAVASSGRSVSALGFFHPYCYLFKLDRCDSFAWPEVGGWDAALWANVPALIATKLGHIDNWEAVTGDSLRLLPQYLARNDALTFIHLNIPHLPAAYADKILHLRASSNPLIEYSNNLILTDQILGEIVQDLQQRVSRNELLLVVSTDHWFRNRWYRADVPESTRPVPFIVWKVGDTKGFVLSQPLSTVHTAEMILDYLNGQLTTQTDIASWWGNQPVYPSFIVPYN
jgi:hypothetical protein